MSVFVGRSGSELRLVGDFQLRLDDGQITLPPTAQRLLGYLALQPGPVLRTHASERLWLDLDSRRAGACLRSALWRLSPRGVVGCSRTHVWLDPGVDVDVHRIEEHALSLLGSTFSDGLLPTLIAELLDAGDELLAGWEDDWVVVERERFRQIRLQALDRLGEALICSGRCDDALMVALAETRAEPLRESAYRVLLKVHLAQGNVAEAVREYRHFAGLLRDALNLRPSKAMRDLLGPLGPALG